MNPGEYADKAKAAKDSLAAAIVAISDIVENIAPEGQGGDWGKQLASAKKGLTKVNGKLVDQKQELDRHLDSIRL